MALYRYERSSRIFCDWPCCGAALSEGGDRVDAVALLAGWSPSYCGTWFCGGHKPVFEVPTHEPTR